MKGISFITDEKNNKTAIVIDLKTIEKKDDEVHEYIDLLVAESRKGESSIEWNSAKKILKSKNKI
jgi:hypothetical protein